MKLLISCLLLVGGFDYMDALVPSLKRHKAACIEELKLDASKYPDMEPNPEMMKDVDHDHKCLLRCMLQKVGAVDSKEEFQPEALKQDLPPEMTKMIDFEKCAPAKEEDPCEKSFKIAYCLAEQLVGQFPKKN